MTDPHQPRMTETLLTMLPCLLVSSNTAVQFGFQQGCSTVQCTWAVQQTISHYLRRGSDVYCCLLDFSKAFDKVNYDQLFKKLLSREVPAVVLRLIIFIYLNQSCFIRWNSMDSDSFSVKNGVRQGAILSPSLFCVYLDTLLSQLRDAGLGCHVGGVFLGAYGLGHIIKLFLGFLIMQSVFWVPFYGRN